MCEVIFYPINAVPAFIINQIKADYEVVEEIGMGEIYDEQLFYIKGIWEDAYFVTLFCDDIYMGGVALYPDTKYDSNRPMLDVPSPGFQGIAKSQEGMKHPEIKLNSYLIPAIINFLKERGFDRVHVAPVGKQSRILLDHYDFEWLCKHDNQMLRKF